MPARMVILIGAVVIALSILGAGFLDRYQIATTYGDGPPMVWRLDKHTGDVTVCMLNKSGDPFLDAPTLKGEKPTRLVDRLAVNCGHEPSD